MFIGTGNGVSMNFNNNAIPTENIHSAREKNICGMIADGNRIRRDDYIIFYVQQSKNFGGAFYGIFQAKDDNVFLDKSQENKYPDLPKSLAYRQLIKPYKIYKKGVTEWEALDAIDGLTSPNQMLWSLIYRKLKGNRGNTMITLYESDRLINMIASKNDNAYLTLQDDESVSFDSEQAKIIKTNQPFNEYTAEKEPINILPRLIAQYNNAHAHEIHLQSYIIQIIGKDINTSLDQSIFLEDTNPIEWIGNEVSCGVGMQRMDIVISKRGTPISSLYPIELKCVKAEASHINQLYKYIDWLRQYYIPNKPSVINPIILTRSTSGDETVGFIGAIEQFNDFYENNRCINLNINRLRWIQYNVDNNKLVFSNTNLI
jgi:Predicted nuclease of the RecB family